MTFARSARRVVPALVLASTMWAAGAGPALGGRIDPAKVALVQAVYLYKFTKLIRWPAEAFAAADSPIVIGILEDAGLADALEDGIPDEQAGGRTVVVRRLAATDLASAGEFRDCHVLFVPAARRSALDGLQDLLSRTSILTVGNGRSFAEEDGMIEFYLNGDRVGIRINVDRINRRNLKVSSRLLKLATIVEDGGG